MRLALTLLLLLPDETHPLSPEKRLELTRQFDDAIKNSTLYIEANPKEIDGYSTRGDARFKRGQFSLAVADYEKMVELDPQQGAGHWRRGIAWFYAGDYAKAAHQFEIYQTHDDVDRENGIWRFFSQAKSLGLEKARQGLLKYAKDDREPFPSVYKLFEKKMTAEEIVKQIESAPIDDLEREKRRFYAHLYIGLNAAIEDRKEDAIPHLRRAVENPWGPRAGYGPNYMWHVGRLHYEILAPPKKD